MRWPWRRRVDTGWWNDLCACGHMSKHHECKVGACFACKPCPRFRLARQASNPKKPKRVTYAYRPDYAPMAA